VYYGDRIYWVYTVDNETPRPLDVSLAVNKQDEDQLCQLTAIPVEGTASCTWTQQIIPAVVDDQS
jgi:hypothetical protein